MEKVSLKKTASSSLLEENFLDWNLVQKSFEKYTENDKIRPKFHFFSTILWKKMLF